MEFVHEKVAEACVRPVRHGKGAGDDSRHSPLAAKPSPLLFAAACSYDTIHRTIVGALPKLQAAGFATPDYLVAISGGAIGSSAGQAGGGCG